MASAAAVGADIDRSPLGSEEDDVAGIKSKVTGNDEGVENNLFGDEDEDDDVPSRSRKPGRTQATNGEDEEGEGMDDLFGDDDDAEPAPRRRQLDDSELDSGDDDGRVDRVDAEEEVEVEAQERTVQDVDLPRIPVPQPSDGEMYLLKVPQFLAVDAKAFSADEFEAPTTDHHAKVASKTFSASRTAATTIRWRRSPSKPSELQSNARINRWSDGSLTLQFASDPQTQYEISGNALAPPQRNPVKPTPTSIHSDKNKAGRRGVDGESKTREAFDPSKHAFTYLVMPLPGRGLIRVTNALTAGLTVAPPSDFMDQAIINLQSDLAKASSNKSNGIGAVEWTETTEDPELAKKRAEQAEREKMRARKKQDAQIERERERSNRTLGRHGLASSRYGGGLSAGMLEDDDGLATTRGGRAAPRAKPRRQRRANSEYSSEEDYGRRAFQVSKEDDYDVEDDFVAASDEEEEVVDDEEDEDDGIIEEGRAARRESPKRARDDEDADGEEEEEITAAGGAERKRKRLVVADDDDDE